MLTRLYLAMPRQQAMAQRLAAIEGAPAGRLLTRRFPDGEHYVRVMQPVAGREVAVVCSLDRPDGKLLALLFAARALREQGARSIGLVSPYLPYMRQDAMFNVGETETSACFARLLSGAFDWLVTVDPHLHRHRSLDELYSIPTRVAPAAPAIADWIAANVTSPLLVGPDVESEQWVGQIARTLGAPFVVMSKARLGDRKVRFTLPDLAEVGGRQPVLIDDILSSGETMAGAAEALVAHGFAKPICMAVHVLARAADLRRLAATSRSMLGSNTTHHALPTIDVTEALSKAIADLS